MCPHIIKNGNQLWPFPLHFCSHLWLPALNAIRSIRTWTKQCSVQWPEDINCCTLAWRHAACSWRTYVFHLVSWDDSKPQTNTWGSYNCIPNYQLKMTKKNGNCFTMRTLDVCSNWLVKMEHVRGVCYIQRSHTMPWWICVRKSTWDLAIFLTE